MKIEDSILKTEIVPGELPYRIQLDNWHGAGISPAKALIVALSAGGILPSEEPELRDRHVLASRIFWNFGPSSFPHWTRVIKILEKDTFEEDADEEAREISP